MKYKIAEVDIDDVSGLALAGDEEGLALVVRRSGRVVGFVMEGFPAGARIEADRIARMIESISNQISPDRAREPDSERPISLTVAICSRDRAQYLTSCLTALTEFRERHELTGGGFEILVVDNAPPNNSTRSVVAGFAGVRYTCEPIPGLDVARNRALREASGDVVAFIDDDVEPDRNWINELQSAWSRNPDAAAVSGLVLPYELVTEAQVAFERRGGFREGFVPTRYSGLSHPGNLLYPYAATGFGAGCNMSFKREVALSLGGFDPALDTGPPLPGGGDLDMLHRVVRNGGVLVYEPACVVFHKHRRDRDSLKRQYRSWGTTYMAYLSKTYRADPPGRAVIRLTLSWWLRDKLHELAGALRPSGRHDLDLVLAELAGGLPGLFGAYGRSVRRMAQRSRGLTPPVVAILPWGYVIEDYLDDIDVTVDDFVGEMTGGWMFGFIDSFDRAGVKPILVVVSSSVTTPQRTTHHHTGAVVWILPATKVWKWLHSELDHPYAMNGREAIGQRRGLGAGRALAAWLILPYTTTPLGALRNIMRREGVSALLCQEYEEGRFDLAVALGRRLGTPVFATFQGGDYTRTWGERLIRRISVRRAAGFVIAAGSEASRVESRYGIEPSRIARIPNPIEVSAPVDDETRAVARARLGVAPDETVVLWHGRVEVVRKGLDVLIDAWATLEQTSSNRNRRLLLVGSGQDAAELRRRIDAAGLKNLFWHDEYILDRTQVGQFLAAADVYAFPSRHEGFAVAPLEAMAAGLPVVAADAPGVRELLGDEQPCGVLVRPGDPESLADGLRLLIDDVELARTMGRNARARVIERFSESSVGAGLRSFIFRDHGLREASPA